MEWIAVKSRLPTEDKLYIINVATADMKKPFTTLAWYDPNGFGWSIVPKYWINSITHWMELPLPPEEID